MESSAMKDGNFEINAGLDSQKLAAQFQAVRRIHAANFLAPAAAEVLASSLRETDYRTFVVTNEEEVATPPGEEGRLSAEEVAEVYDIACEGARNGFASFYESDRALSDTAASSDEAMRTAYERCVEFLGSEAFLSFVRNVTGQEKVSRVEVRATRFRPGHFLLFHNGTFAADTTGKRRFVFELNLTPQWRPEWGGMLELRGREGHDIEGVLPCFNCLDLFEFPRGYWVSQVTPYAHASRYALTGAIYAD